MKLLSKFLCLTACVLAVACESNLDLMRNNAEIRELTFDSYFDNSGESKTELSKDDPTVILWSVKDSISLFWENYSASCFTSLNDKPSEKTQFSGSISIISGAYEQGYEQTPKFYAVYPYRKTNVCKDGLLTFDVDTEQYGVAGSLPLRGFPAIARSENMNLAFRNVCGGLSFSLTNTNIKYIELESVTVGASQPAIAGTVKAGFDASGCPVISEVVKPASKITLWPSDGDTFQTDTLYYVTMLPGVLQNGFKMTFYTQMQKGSKTIDSSIEVKRSIFGKLLDVDKDLDFTESVASVTISSDEYELELGTDYKFNAVIEPDYATDKRVTWKSSDENIATVAEDGTVTPVAAGACRIMVQSLDNKLACDTCEIKCIKVNYLSRIGKDPAWANCYIIPETGIYDLEAVRGVSGASIGTPASACVLWEYVSSSDIATKGCLISSVVLKNGKVRVITPATLKNGSASVAVKDSKGQILWSWHLWINQGYDPAATGQVYKTGTQVMDRHLGALTSEKGCPRALMYQWGRKDPFLPENKPSAFSSAEWPDKVACSSTTGTIAYSVANPMSFIKGSSVGNDWYFATDAGRTTRWKDTEKTDYDPCPYGWRVPTGGAGGFWESASDTKAYKWDFAGKGADLQAAFGLTKAEWYATTGYLDTDGISQANASVAYLWTTTCVQNTSYILSVNYALEKIGTSNNEYRAEGCGIRCVKEK